MRYDESLQAEHDLLNRGWIAFVVFWLPGIVLIASGFFALPSLTRAIIWTIALATIGSGCIANALRCGRVHCYFTGPLFIALAAVTLFFGLGILPLGKHGWSIISLATLVGAAVLCFGPEFVLGRYRWRKPFDRF